MYHFHIVSVVHFPSIRESLIFFLSVISTCLLYFWRRSAFTWFCVLLLLLLYLQIFQLLEHCNIMSKSKVYLIWYFNITLHVQYSRINRTTHGLLKWVQDVSAILVPVWPHFIKTFRPWFYLCCFMCYL
jgi:hypothetical protein